MNTPLGEEAAQAGPHSLPELHGGGGSPGQPAAAWRSGKVEGTWAPTPAAALPQLSVMCNVGYSCPAPREFVLTALARSALISPVSEMCGSSVKAPTRAREESECLKLPFLTGNRVPFAKPDVPQYFRSSQ